MDDSTTISLVNGNYLVKPSHKFSDSQTTNNASFVQQRMYSYMGARNAGGDPVTAICVRGVTTNASVSGRRAEVLRNLTDSLIRYNTGGGSGS
ncbi:hypothetical protein F4803DRAFT_542705 [Xylaria telfairii]|nr:hypothetical protein F4803DRAFT_542705 [Xylaria telfairii]